MNAGLRQYNQTDKTLVDEENDIKHATFNKRWKYVKCKLSEKHIVTNVTWHTEMHYKHRKHKQIKKRGESSTNQIKGF